MRITKRILSILFVPLLFSCLASFSAYAQTRSLKGVVVDDTHQGVVGAAVMIKGTTIGVATDINGNFELSVKTGDVLVISSVGYDDVEIAVTDNTASPLSVSLSISQELLDDVVVIGYGTTRAKNFTGSVDVVRMEDSPVADLGIRNLADMLRGRLSGVNMGAPSSRVGQNASIMVRGRRSINSTSSNPLLVVNGVIFTGNLEDIDSNSIESVSVLKDATSLAAYGSKAANGVIMITTKKGKEGKPMINFSTSQELSGRSYSTPVLSPENYIKYRNVRLGIEDITNTSWMSFLEKANYDKWKAGTGGITDWLDLTTRTGYTSNYNLNFSGRTARSNYYIALGRSDMRGILIGDHVARNNYSVIVSTHINDYIELGTNVSYTNTVDTSNAAGTNIKLGPFMEPYLPDGETVRYYVEGVNNSSTNPLWSYVHGNDKDNRRANFNVGGFVSVNIPWIEGLNYKINLSYTEISSKNKSFKHEDSEVVLLGEDWEGLGQTPAYYNLSNANGSITSNLSTNWVIDNILSYSHSFGQHYVSGSLVYTRDSADSTRESMTGSSFNNAGNTLLGWFGLGNADNISITSPTYTLHTDVGYLARAIYSYKDTYHLNISYRRDGSSVFGQDKKWGGFPAFGAAWTISNESFMKNINWLDMLKLKLSWGQNGAQTIEPYGTLSTLALAKNGGIPNYYGGTIHWGQKLSTLGNSELGWQTTTSWNGGFEGDFLKGRIHIDVNAYYSKTTDQIFNRNIPVMTAGITTQRATMGQVDNKGLEINLSTQNIKKSDFSWTSDFVFTLNRNKLVDLYGDNQDDITSGLFLGKPLSSIYTYEVSRINPENGEPFFFDEKGEEVTNPAASDRRIIGYGDENFRLNVANTLNYKNLRLYIIFTGIFGGNGFGLANNTFAYSTYDTTAAISAYDIPFWSPDNHTSVYPKPNMSDSKYQIYNSFGHIRLQDISLSYNFRKAADKIGVSSARLTLSGRNLFFIAPHWKFSDPQARSGNGYLPRTVNLGLNVSF